MAVLLDVVLVVMLAAYAWSGWHQGFVAAVFGLVGLVAGALLTLRFVPGLLEDVFGIDRGTAVGALVVILLVIAAATAAQAGMLVVASRVTDAVRLPAARVVDSLLGLVAVVVASVLLVWVVAGALRTGGPPPIRDAIARSVVVGIVDAAVPPPIAGVVDDITSALDREGFPRVFDGLGPEPIAPAASPDPALVSDPEVASALGSVVRIRADADACGRTQVGSGWVAGPERVVTNAHVVAGARSFRVSVRGTGAQRRARVVLFDPGRDIAVLSVPGLRAPPLARGAELDAGDSAVLAGFPGDDALTVTSARVRDVLAARGADIYGVPGRDREIYSLRARVRQGASGGPVIDPDGMVVGMVFATSLDDPDTGYALTLDEIGAAVRGGVAASARVSTGRCTSD
jgi:S1-C subfamily serine protease